MWVALSQPSKNLSDGTKCIQKRAMRTVFPDLKYPDALEMAGIPTLYAKRESLSRNLFNDWHTKIISLVTFYHQVSSSETLKEYETFWYSYMKNRSINEFLHYKPWHMIICITTNNFCDILVTRISLLYIYCEYLLVYFETHNSIS